MDIKSGEYVRSKDGIIDKVIDFYAVTEIFHCENGMCIDTQNMCGTYLKNITKHSFNIIDLIEVGDYVNGSLVTEVDEKTFTVIQPTGGQTTHHKMSVHNIKSIVTKEQFKSIEYKIGD